MAKKQAAAREASLSVKPARKPAPRVNASKHRAIMPEVDSPGTGGETRPALVPEISHEAIAVTAYTYWEARGYQGGEPVEDWLRAEGELLRAAGK